MSIWVLYVVMAINGRVETGVFQVYDNLPACDQERQMMISFEAKVVPDPNSRAVYTCQERLIK